MMIHLLLIGFDNNVPHLLQTSYRFVFADFGTMTTSIVNSLLKQKSESKFIQFLYFESIFCLSRWKKIAQYVELIDYEFQFRYENNLTCICIIKELKLSSVIECCHESQTAFCTSSFYKLFYVEDWLKTHFPNSSKTIYLSMFILHTY
jgi:hypothetical protein